MATLAFGSLGARTQIVVRGEDRASFLHGMCTNDVKGLRPGQGRECFFTNVQGKTLCHAFLFCREDAIEIDTTPGRAETLIAHLDRYIIREDVQLADESASRCELLLAIEPSESFPLQLAGLPERTLDHADTEFAGFRANVRRVSWTGSGCWFLSCVQECAEKVQRELLEAMEALRRWFKNNLRDSGMSGAEIDCIQWSPDEIEARRIAWGMPYFGRDITPANLPQEVARDEQAISFNKGCYIGQETVARIDALGHVNRYLVRLRIAAEDAPAAGTPLLSQGAEKPVGEITSSARSPRGQGIVALGYVRRGHHEAGKNLTAAGAAARIIGREG